MAWRAYLTALAPTTNNQLQVTVSYYDDADPGNATVDATHPPGVVLHTKSWVNDPDTPLALLRNAVQREGAAARAALAQRDTILQSFAIGSTIAVP